MSERVCAAGHPVVLEDAEFCPTCGLSLIERDAPDGAGGRPGWMDWRVLVLAFVALVTAVVVTVVLRQDSDSDGREVATGSAATSTTVPPAILEAWCTGARDTATAWTALQGAQEHADFMADLARSLDTVDAYDKSLAAAMANLDASEKVAATYEAWLAKPAPPVVSEAVATIQSFDDNTVVASEQEAAATGLAQIDTFVRESCDVQIDTKAIRDYVNYN